MWDILAAIIEAPALLPLELDMSLNSRKSCVSK